MDLKTHNARMVDRFIWLETVDLTYAIEAMEAYRRDPFSPNPNILADIKEEKARRASLLRSTNTQPLLPGTTDGDRK
jgi:hypothetical protein